MVCVQCLNPHVSPCSWPLVVSFDSCLHIVVSYMLWYMQFVMVVAIIQLWTFPTMFVVVTFIMLTHSPYIFLSSSLSLLVAMVFVCCLVCCLDPHLRLYPLSPCCASLAMSFFVILVLACRLDPCSLLCSSPSTISLGVMLRTIPPVLNASLSWPFFHWVHVQLHVVLYRPSQLPYPL